MNPITYCYKLPNKWADTLGDLTNNDLRPQQATRPSAWKTGDDNDDVTDDHNIHF